MRNQINVYSLAYYIINSGEYADLNPLKLQKLLYYIQSWHIVFSGHKLFENDFEAWIHGPVIREVFGHFRSKNILMYDPIPENHSRDYDLNKYLNNEQIEIIEDVLEEYGDKTPYHLECLTHAEKPWIEARKDCAVTDSCNNIINNETIRAYYTSLLDV